MSGRFKQERTIRQVTHEAMEVASRMKRAGQGTWVVALVVLTGTKLAEGRIDLRKATILEADDIVDFIRSRVARLSPTQVVQAADAILQGGASDESRAATNEGPI